MRPPRSKRLFIYCYCAGGQGRETLKTARATCAAGAGWEELLFVDDGLVGARSTALAV